MVNWLRNVDNDHLNHNILIINWKKNLDNAISNNLYIKAMFILIHIYKNIHQIMNYSG